MKQLLQIFLAASILILIVTYFLKDKYPDSSTMLPELQYEPVQTPVSMAPFTIQKKGVTYTLTPLYSYDLVGMVVTFHKSDDLSDLSHAEWKDWINIEDVCVLWGSNLLNNYYKKVEFSSGNWTCFFHTNDRETYDAFNLQAISNSHLLTTDPRISKTIRSARRGDQIRLKGYLVNYTIDNGGSRNTSISRQDIGQGACEVVYVTDFQILKKGSPVFAPLFTLSKYTIAACMILLFVTFVYDTKASRENSSATY
jgi:hypothetical protein